MIAPAGNCSKGRQAIAGPARSPYNPGKGRHGRCGHRYPEGHRLFRRSFRLRLAQIAGLTEARSYRAGELIVEERTAAERFFIIIRGKISISKRFADGDEFVLGVHSDGSSSGKWGCWRGPALGHGAPVEPTTLVRSPAPTSKLSCTRLRSCLPHPARVELRCGNRALLVSFLERRNAKPTAPTCKPSKAFCTGPGCGRRRWRSARGAGAGADGDGLFGGGGADRRDRVVLRALRIPAEPPALPAPPSRARPGAAACEGFAELPPTAAASRRRRR